MEDNKYEKDILKRARMVQVEGLTFRERMAERIYLAKIFNDPSISKDIKILPEEIKDCFEMADSFICFMLHERLINQKKFGIEEILYDK